MTHTYTSIMGAIPLLFMGACATDSPEPEAGPDAAEPEVDEFLTEPCSGKAGAPGRETRMIELDDSEQREAFVYIPENLDPNEPTPLLFVFHGYGGNGKGEANGTFVDLAEEEGFIVIAPDGAVTSRTGNSPSWNLGTPPICGVAGFVSDYDTDNPEVNRDFELMEKLYEDVSAEHCVDRKRVFATGFSQGSGFTHNVGCDGPDFIRAIAPNAQGTNDEKVDCQQDPKPVMMLVGTSDIVTIDCQRDARNAWIERNGCSPEIERVEGVEGGTCEYYEGCPRDAQVAYCEFEGLGHSFGGEGYEKMDRLIWDFLIEQSD